MTRAALLRLLFVFAVFAGPFSFGQNSQSYLNDTGSTPYGITIPVENGFIDVSNGNLHLEFPFATHPQRGALKLDEKLVYDSRIWMFSPFGSGSSYHWWPYNVPGASQSSGGWRFVKGTEIGSTTSDALMSETVNYPCGLFGPTDTIDVYSMVYIDPNGTIHPLSATQQEENNQCTGDDRINIFPGFAQDGSGYEMNSDGTVVDKDGTQVYPQITDRYGNYWSSDGSGNLIDDVGRTPVLVTQNGNVTYYDVLVPNGPINNQGTRVRYTVTSASVPVNTDFRPYSQSDIYPWTSPGLLTPVQSIVLPDGSQYTFGYDATGELSSVTLPTGGIITYGYGNFVDSSNTENRWLTSRTQGSNPSMTFTPSVVTNCVNYSTGCVESVKLHKPSGDETVYQLTLINGAWNTGTTVYTGSATGGQQLAQSTSVNHYTNGCSNASQCRGANYLIDSTTTTTLSASPGPSLATQSFSTFDQASGKLTADKEWDYYSGSPSATPNRETDYVYATNVGNDLQKVTVYNNGSQAGQTNYAYTSTATTTSGVAQHGSQNAGGPYLQSVSHWLNTGGSPTTTYTMDDTGQVLSLADPNGHSTNFTYQCANSLPYQTTNALNQTTQYGYDCNSGAISSSKDPNDIANSRNGTTYSYESAGRVQTIAYPDGGQTSYSYPSSTEVDTTTLATPNPSVVSQSIADAYGRPYQTITGGAYSETTYDGNGRTLCVTNPHFTTSSTTDGSTCATAYDGLDRPTLQTNPDNTTLQWSYNGSTVTSTDEAGKSWQRTTNAFGQLTTVIEPGNLSTTYSYGGLGNIKTISQNGALGEAPRTRTFIYDSLSRLTNECHPESIAVGQHCSTSGPWSASIGYDPNGNAETRTDARGLTTTLSYDALNRLTVKAHSDGTPNQYFNYDQASNWSGPQANTIGRLSQAATSQDMRYFGGGAGPACNPLSSITANYNPANGNPTYCQYSDELYSYDAMGRQIRIAAAFPSEAGHDAHEIDLGHDLAGNLTTLRYPDGRVVKQEVDAAGHLQSVTFDNWNGTHVGYTYASNFTYYPSGSQHEITLGNATYINRPRNSRQQQCQTWSDNLVTGRVWIDNHVYFGGNEIYCNNVPGNDGNVTEIKDWRNPNHTQYFSYDNLNRISSFHTADSIASQTYNPDSFGNLSQSGTLSTSLGFDSNNRINSGGYSYDAAGNLISFYNGAFTSYYAFDAESRLFNFNSGAAYYAYDANGERIRKDVGGAYTEYQYLGGTPIAEKHSDGTWSDYVYANGLMIARADNYEKRIHIHGTTGSSGGADSWYLPVSGHVLAAGETLCWSQFQIGSVGGIGIQFTDSTTTNWTTTDSDGQVMNNDTTQNHWHRRCTDLSTFQGKTISAAWVNSDYGTPPGSWDSYFADIAFSATDGTVTPVYIKQDAISLSEQTAGTVSNTGAAVETIAAVGDAESAPNSTTYYLGDQIGSTVLTTAGSGWPVSSDTYYPFGQEPTPSIDPNHYKFAGLERDSESNLDHAMFRQLSLTQGRWMSPDPYDGSMDLGNPQSLNRYSYVLNGPLRYTDPLGLQNGEPVRGQNCTGACSLFATLIVDGIDALFRLGHHPQFHGSMTPRPNNDASFSYSSDVLGTSGNYTIYVDAFYQTGKVVLPKLLFFGFPSKASDQSSVLDRMPFNGNMLPLTPQPQDQLCSTGIFANPMNANPAVLSCCQAHDDCYAAHGCNVTSWVPNPLPWGSCNSCNAKAAACVTGAVLGP